MDSETGLADVLSEFARTILTEFPIQAILDHLVVRIVDLLPITSAGVTLISEGSLPHFIAASDAAALQYETLQSESEGGPCTLAFTSGVAVSVPDLAVDDRFPSFGLRARELGLAATFTFPLRHGETCLGALDLYRETPGALDEHTMAIAQTLADVAAAYLLNAQARDNLREAADVYRARAMVDPLTGLPNRVVLHHRLEQASHRAHRSGRLLAVLFIDVDRFKQVNDLHGHLAGDELLIAVGQRLRSVVRPDDTVARLAGDEFVVLCENLEIPDQADRLAHRVVAALGTPFALSSSIVTVSVSIGIAWSGQDETPAAQLLTDADDAMYTAKRAGGARHHRFSMHGSPDRSRSTLQSDLRDALTHDGLRNVYQPIVTATNAEVVGIESLLRWDHPVHGSLPPDLTIPLAEQSGLIVELGRWVMERACIDRHEMQLALPDRELQLCVNVSAVELMTKNFQATVRKVLERTGTAPRLLTLEVTESVYIDDAERAVVVLEQLKELGVGIALDDFGTGYSSLIYLQRFPIDVIKLDREFIARLGQNDTSTVIVRAVIDLAHDLGTQVIAEGVETEDQHERLLELGCDSCQGYLFARPLPKPAFIEHVGTRAKEPAR